MLSDRTTQKVDRFGIQNPALRVGGSPLLARHNVGASQIKLAAPAWTRCNGEWLADETETHTSPAFEWIRVG